MASASSKVGGLTAAVRVLTPLAVGSAGYAAYRINWAVAVRKFLTGPGRSSRILLLLFVAFNWKNLPFAWTYRVFYAILYHNVLRKSPALTPRALFKPLISETRTPLLEIDYNLHKSNSTYFTDLDVSRTHLVGYLCRPALRKLAHNPQTRLIQDPRTGKPAKGSLGILLGAVGCSFKREIAAYKGYELWSRVLSWDRKWMYIITHFVPKGAARPTEWLDPRFGKVRARGPGDAMGGWETKIHATAVSKYVFKLGRITVHPAVVLEESGLLPPRPDGGWTSGDAQLGDESADVADVDLSKDGEWDWRRVEAQRRKGMELASQFQGLDESHALFTGGSGGALGTFGPC
ncbi:capsule polysaccharide biosynthesis protein [Purpureocillium lilacinum]|uniref:Capsule polysaccharide biosynthesis protein n=1 Tax=Purpureocillium lilacinum TaxID=33203 RepID=A0A179HL40_PURLI|nr:capsule polysaccharide biosynthesis protein [Purpureocillium lilacinum]OAQ90388.1 capsule polysaccharide biosynthesis protein [Purpureocillium lilacinum]